MNLDSIKQLVQDVLDGEENPLKAYGIINEHIKQLKICSEEVKEEAILEALKQDDKTFTNAGFIFSLKEGRANHDFKHIDAWVKADKVKKDIEAKAKLAFQAYKQKMNTADQEGEVAPMSVVTYSKESLSVKVAQV